jgi:signal transduction histidine kinase
MASIGQLAAGLAHEINNPLGFILGNIQVLKDYVGRYRDMLTMFHQKTQGLMPPDTQRTIQEAWRRMDLDFVSTDSDDLIRQSLDGAERVKRIVLDLKGFSHVDDGDYSMVDLNSEIDKTLSVLTHQTPTDAKIVKDYTPLPLYRCRPVHLGMAFLNILQNAFQAKPKGLEVRISTRKLDEAIEVVFSDNGPGIPEDIRRKIFDPFFTTKPPGHGTGLGLTTTHNAVADHGGHVDYRPASTGGAEFVLTLPLSAGADAEGSAGELRTAV